MKSVAIISVITFVLIFGGVLLISTAAAPVRQRHGAAGPRARGLRGGRAGVPGHGRRARPHPAREGGAAGHPPGAREVVQEQVPASAKLLAVIAELEARQARVRRGARASATRLAKMYEAMKPDQAATILSAMDMDVILEIMTRMKERQAAKILASMDAVLAAQISTRLSTRGGDLMQLGPRRTVRRPGEAHGAAPGAETTRRRGAAAGVFAGAVGRPWRRRRRRAVPAGPADRLRAGDERAGTTAPAAADAGPGCDRQAGSSTAAVRRRRGLRAGPGAAGGTEAAAVANGPRRPCPGGRRPAGRRRARRPRSPARPGGTAGAGSDADRPVRPRPPRSAHRSRETGHARAAGRRRRRCPAITADVTAQGAAADRRRGATTVPPGRRPPRHRRTPEAESAEAAPADAAEPVAAAPAAPVPAPADAAAASAAHGMPRTDGTAAAAAGGASDGAAARPGRRQRRPARGHGRASATPRPARLRAPWPSRSSGAWSVPWSARAAASS